MERAARRALVHADRSARLREAMAARMLVAWAVAGGPIPVPEAIRACQQLVEVADREHPAVLASAATLRAMLGEIDDARVSCRPCAGAGHRTDARAVADDDSCARPGER